MTSGGACTKYGGDIETEFSEELPKRPRPGSDSELLEEPADRDDENSTKSDEDGGGADGGGADDGGGFGDVAHVFVDGFERASLIGEWSQVLGFQGSLAIGSGEAFEGNSFLRSSISGEPGEPRNLQLNLARTKSVSLAFAVRVPSVSRSVNIGAIKTVSDSNEFVNVFFVLRNNMIWLAEFESSSGVYIERGSSSFDFGQWSKLSLELDKSKSIPTVEATVDGRSVFSGTLNRTIPEGDTILVAGCNYVSDGVPFTVDIDGLRAEWTKGL